MIYNFLPDFIVLVIAALGYYHLFKKITALEHQITKILSPFTDDVKKPCAVMTYRYADGHVAEKHTCAGIPVLDLTRELGERLHPGSLLISMTPRQHSL